MKEFTVAHCIGCGDHGYLNQLERGVYQIDDKPPYLILTWLLSVPRSLTPMFA